MATAERRPGGVVRLGVWKRSVGGGGRTIYEGFGEDVYPVGIVLAKGPLA